MAIPGSPFTRQFLENSVVLEQPAKRRPNGLLERIAASGRLYRGRALRLFSCNATLVCDSHAANITIFSTYLLQRFVFSFVDYSYRVMSVLFVQFFVIEVTSVLTRVESKSNDGDTATMVSILAIKSLPRAV